MGVARGISYAILIVVLAILAVVIPAPWENRIEGADGRHVDVWLRNESGEKITPSDNASDPYSPRKTCGACHSYSTISRGNHFQGNASRGRGRASSPALPPAMTRDNRSRFQKDDERGVDCLVCHMTGYRLDQRNQWIRTGKVDLAPVAGAGLGSFPQEAKSAPNSEPGDFSRRRAVLYRWNSPAFTKEGKLSGSNIRSTVGSASCLLCHGDDQAFHSATLHKTQYDVHIRAGFRCTDCHTLAANAEGGRLAHWIGRISPGKTPEMTGMKTCTGCHLDGLYRSRRTGMPASAPNPLIAHAEKFPKASFHFSLLSCTACHNTGQPAKGAYLLDASTGRTFWYTADNMAAADGAAYRKATEKPWIPWIAIETMKDGSGERYVAAVPHTAQWFAERTARNSFRALPLETVLRAYQTCKGITSVEVKDSSGRKIRRATVATEKDMEQMLRALKRLGHGKAVFIADKVYEWKDGKIASSDLPLANTLSFPVWHNVPAIDRKQTLGAKDCRDCHDEKAPFFGKLKIRNVGRFLKEDYPNPKTPNASPQMEEWGMTEAPAYE